MKAVTYSSFASPGLQPVELSTLIVRSLRNNARDAVTGLLIFNGGAFVQTIEGPGAAVDALLMRIADDQRHCQMVVRDERAIARRIFPGWAVGYVRIDSGGFEGQYAVADALGRKMPDAIRSVLMSMAETLPFE